MEYVVLLEKEKGHYRAVVPALSDCEDGRLRLTVVKGQTRADMLSRMRQAIIDKLSKVEITRLEVDIEPSLDPWDPFIGMWKSDPTWDEFQMEIAKYCELVDKEHAHISK